MLYRDKGALESAEGHEYHYNGEDLPRPFKIGGNLLRAYCKDCNSTDATVEGAKWYFRDMDMQLLQSIGWNHLSVGGGVLKNRKSGDAINQEIKLRITEYRRESESLWDPYG